jgi:hypothetical protein
MQGRVMLDGAKIGVSQISNRPTGSKCDSYSLISFGNAKSHSAGAMLRYIVNLCTPWQEHIDTRTESTKLRYSEVFLSLSSAISS